MRRVVLFLFGVTLFLGSTLLFLLEPMVGRMLLPLLGGVPAVWNTCLVFFQVTLVGGYIYARLFAKWLTPRHQLAAHAVVLILPLLVLPVRVVVLGAPPAQANPIAWLLAALALSVGLPFLVVATTAPLLQQWFSWMDHPDARDPYFLYAASNLGSFAALVAYPTVVEPFLGLRAQAIAWTWLYIGFAGLVVTCALTTWRMRATDAASAIASIEADQPATRERDVTWPRVLRWLLLAAVPSSLLLGTTTYLSTDIAAMPMLWVIPLALYLLTFVVAFARRTMVSTNALAIAAPILIIPLLLAVLLGAVQPPLPLALLHLVTFVVVALMCHRLLADDRPSKQHLTSFYLWMSVGGAVGGAFNAVAAPLLFRGATEYPLALVVACFLKPARGRAGDIRFVKQDVLLPAGLAVAAFVLVESASAVTAVPPAASAAVALAIPALVSYLFSARPVRFGLAIAVLVGANMIRPDAAGTLLDAERSFFGIHRVVDDPRTGTRWLFHGTTIHGGQRTDAAHAAEPLTYYTRSGPLGQVFKMLAERQQPKRAAVVGLGGGAVASYAHAGETWTFYEIDPVVVGLARDSGYFTFLGRSPARTTVVVGDARLSLATAADGAYDLLLLDAFSSDAVPIHLVTREALRIYMKKLAPGGMLVFHTSNRYFAVSRIVADLARDAGLVHLWRHDRSVSQEEARHGKTSSQFVVVARATADLGSLASNPGWTRVPEAGGRVWTDDYASPLGLLLR